MVTSDSKGPFWGQRSRGPLYKVKILCKGPFWILELAPLSDLPGLILKAQANFLAQVHWWFYAYVFLFLRPFLVLGLWDPHQHLFIELYMIFLCWRVETGGVGLPPEIRSSQSGLGVGRRFLAHFKFTIALCNCKFTMHQKLCQLWNQPRFVKCIMSATVALKF